MAQKLKITEIKGQSLAAKDIGGTSDPYYVITPLNEVDGEARHGSKTKGSVIKKNLDPVWSGLNLSFDIGAQSDVAKLKIEIFDHDFVGKHDFMGQAIIRICDLATTGSKQETLSLTARPGKSDKVKGSIVVTYECSGVAPATTSPAVAAPASNAAAHKFDYEAFDAVRDKNLDAWEATKKTRLAAWNGLSAEEQKAKIDALVDSVKPTALPAPDAFLPALAKHFLMYGPMDSPMVLYYTLQEFPYDDKLPVLNPQYFYQLPRAGDSHPSWPASWGPMTKMCARGGYVVSLEFKGPDHYWQLLNGSSANMSFADLVKVVQTWQHANANEQAQFFFNRLDTNKSGFLEKEEIAAGEASTLSQAGHTLTNVVRNCLDDLPGVPPAGGIEATKKIREALRAVYACHFGQFLEASVNNILSIADTDKDGKLSLAEYTALRSADKQAQLKAWINEHVVRKCLDLFVQEGGLVEAQVAPFRTIELF